MLEQVIIFKLMNTMYSLKSLKASANPCQYIEEVRAYISHVGERILAMFSAMLQCRSMKN